MRKSESGRQGGGQGRGMTTVLGAGREGGRGVGGAPSEGGGDRDVGVEQFEGQAVHAVLVKSAGGKHSEGQARTGA